MRTIILASGSPRRRELLEQIGIPFQVMKSDAEEIITKSAPEEVVLELSAQKAEAVAEQVEEGVILGADTIVAIDGEILGKPAGREHAGRMLKQLQGRTHSVFTGVTLIGKQAGKKERRSFFRETKVQIHSMSEEEIEAYLDTGDAFDKAGSYGIQGPFAAYVDGIEGDYSNVVGLPVSAVYQALKEF
ncbi:MAG: Maf family protein [Lachnospiraceae bacterium]|nr:Maf family protein [Lachnospiraceae bacterium]